MIRKVTIVAVVMLCLAAAAAESVVPPEYLSEELYIQDAIMIDQSQEELFELLDVVNDEDADVSKYGALTATEHLLRALDNGSDMQMEMHLQNSDLGNIIIGKADMEGYDYCVYTAQQYLCTTLNGVISGTMESGTAEEFDYYFHSYHFPYGEWSELCGVRQDENGNRYILARNGETQYLEYAVDADMRVTQLRIYGRNMTEELILLSYVDYQTGEAEMIPEDVFAALQKLLE